MAYVVTESCVRCKYSDCVAVCPVDCFYELEEMLVINPDECIDCGVCEPECPVGAIFEEADVPEKSYAMVEFNSVMSGAAWDIPDNYQNVPDEPNGIYDQQEPLPGADEAANEDGKIQELVEKYGLQV